MTDQELIGYLDKHFGEISQLRDEVRTLRAETTQKFDELREENRQTRAVLGEEIQQTRAALEGEIQQTRTGLEEQIQQTRAALGEEIQQTRAALEEEDRQTRVMLEDLRSEVRLVAEGVMGQGETFATRQFETMKAIDEVKSLIAPLYQDLVRRVKNLEERAERQSRDVLDVIRERFGKRQEA